MQAIPPAMPKPKGRHLGPALLAVIPCFHPVFPKQAEVLYFPRRIQAMTQDTKNVTNSASNGKTLGTLRRHRASPRFPGFMLKLPTR